MSSPRWTEVCAAESVSTLSPSDYTIPSLHASSSPIDDYYDYVEHLLTHGSAASLAASRPLGRLLLLGLVTGVELYLRSVLAGVVTLCPISRAVAADQTVSFGAVEYYGTEGAAWALFEGASLASANEVKSKTKKLLGIDLAHEASLGVALEQFDLICHLRHAAVHTRGVLGRGNASALGLLASGVGEEVLLEFGTLQDVGAACHSVVRAYNRTIYRRTVERWIGNDRFAGNWSADKPIYEPLFGLFHSKKDALGPANAYTAYRSLVTTLNP